MDPTSGQPRTARTRAALPLPVRIDLLGDADPDVRLQMALELGEGRADVAEGVRTQAYAEARARGRSPDIAGRIAAGRVEQLVHEQVLLEQVSVADPGMLVGDLLRGTEVRIVDFTRLPAPHPS